MLGQRTYGIFQTVFIAFCDAKPIPRLPYTVPTMPMTSAVVFPSSGCTVERSCSPMTGKLPSAESISCSRSAGLSDSAKPRTVASSKSMGKSANRP
jgi:hypothetical protein